MSVMTLFAYSALSILLAAGILAWEKGQLLVVVLLVAATVAAVYLWRVNPEIYVARSRFRKGTKRWDAILLCFLFPVAFMIFEVDPKRWTVLGLG